MKLNPISIPDNDNLAEDKNEIPDFDLWKEK